MIRMTLLSLFALSISAAAIAGSTKTTRAPASDCSQRKCPLAMIHCPAGTKRVDVRAEGACCPKWDCQEVGEGENDCTNVACAKRMPPSCPAGKRAVDNREEGACCPQWECEARTASRCDQVKCADRVRPHCRPGERIRDRRKAGACCPKYVCEGSDLHDASEEVDADEADGKEAPDAE